MKKYIRVSPFVLIVFFNFACQGRGAMAELENFRTQVQLEEQNKALVLRLYEAFNKKDFGVLKELAAPGYAYYSPSNDAKPHALEELIEGLKAFHQGAFPDSSFSVEELIASGNKVVSRWILRGTHQGEFEGIPAAGKKIETSGMLITRIENGKIVEHREDWDMLGLLVELGMELKPRQAKE